MILETLDWLIIAAFLLLTLGIGLSYTRQASQNLENFFLGGRNLPWYIAGISMVATTFAADTPLAVTELVGQSGIAGNWLWWSFLAGGMLTTFFFARLWHKANVLTEVELCEIRYDGASARFLRGFKALYLGLLMNVIIIAWVNVALMSILQVFFSMDSTEALFYTGLAMVFVAIYASFSGLLGVAMTDVIQFVIAMVSCIVLAVLVVQSDKIGGIEGMKAQLHTLAPNALNFFPTIGNTNNAVQTLGLSIGAFFAYIGVQWWASWYPGAEPGGGGYVAQRLMSTRTSKDAVYATLFFQIAHYCIRPWAWIVVGLCAIILYPNLPAADLKLGYVYAMRDFLPVGLRGLLLVAFFAAYMSTISTQLNWGASYIVNDFYHRFFRQDATQTHLVTVSRVVTVLLMAVGLFVTTQLESISSAWKFLMQCGAGLGLVLILRWYWWRINAWSELAAMFAPFVATAFFYWQGVEFPDSFLWTVVFTTIVWLVVTFATPPTDEQVLQNFYDKVQPDGAWTKFRTNLAQIKYEANFPILNLLACWISAITMTYGALFLIGKLVLMEWQAAAVWAIVTCVGFFLLQFFIRRTNVFAD